jgi:hypothetical protein
MAVGLMIFASFIVDNLVVVSLALVLLRWATIIAAFALLLGLVNIMAVHIRRVRERGPWESRLSSLVLLVALIVVVATGLLSGPDGTWSRWVFQYVLVPLQATLFSLLAFFMATAVYRAFRARDWETAIFFVPAGVLVLLGQVPVGARLWDQLPAIKDWIMTVPVVAGMRGILIGIALGTITGAMRLLLGVDRPYND